MSALPLVAALLCAGGSPSAADPFAALRPGYGPDTAAALSLFRARRHRQALRRLGKPADAAGRFLRARLLRALGRPKEAAPLLLALASDQPLLADHFRARAARALLDAGDPAGALRQATAVQADTPALAAAVLTAAEAELALGHPRLALSHAERFLARWPGKPSAAGALWIVRLARRRLGERRRARAAERRLYVAFPGSALADRFPAPRLRPGEALRRAGALAKLHRNRRASRELRGLLRRRGLSRVQRCRAQFLLGRALQRLRRHRTAYAAYRRAERLCQDGDTVARTLYLWGKGLLSRRSTVPAARVLERLARRFPRHRLADDALYLAAQGWRRAHRLGRARAALARLLKEMPSGDLVPAGRFELARLEALAGDTPRAIRRLESMSGEDPHRHGDLRGRPAYALGRLLARTGDRGEALVAYRRCAREPRRYAGAHASTRSPGGPPSRAGASVPPGWRSPTLAWRRSPSPAGPTASVGRPFPGASPTPRPSAAGSP